MIDIGKEATLARTGETVSPFASVTLARVRMSTPNGGSITVSPTIYREWVSLSRATTATGDVVQSFLGWPLEDFTLPNSTEAVYFERGAILLRPDGRCFTVYGTIYLHWRDLYDLKTGKGLNIGLPITEEEAIPNGRRSRFDFADIYWNAARNAAFEVHGGIRDKWYALGGYTGFLGYPLTDESSVLRGTTEIGRYNEFEGGTIFWSGATGAFETHGAIRESYVHRYNGPGGPFGFPTSDETASPGGGKRYNNFQHGCIVWNASDGSIVPYTALSIFVQNINGTGSHTFFESIGASSVWLYANVNVSTTTGINANSHLPPGGGDYGHPSASPGSIYTISPVRADMTVMLTMDGWDHCISTSDAHLGTLRATFNVDNGFGVNQPRHIDDGDFHGDLDMRSYSPDNPNDPNFRRSEFWGFQNVGTTTLSHQQYAETFVDVEASESDFHWWDDFFYNNYFKSIANGGNCFGMSLESIYAERNDSLFSEPIYPIGSGTAMYEINKKQAYQLGASYLDWWVANFLTGHFWDPIKVWHESKAAWDCGDYPVICYTDAGRGSGHCVRPCGPNAYTENATQYIIEVANPNTPGGTDGDASDRIIIDKATNTYTTAYAGNSMWTGGHFTGGILSWAPFCVLSRQPRTPFWEALAAALGAALIILGDGASTRQMTDNRGHLLYKAERVGVSNRWDDLVTDSNAIPGLARVPAFAAFLSHGPLVGRVDGLNLAITGNDGPELYRIVGLPSPYGPAPTQTEFVPISIAGVAASNVGVVNESAEMSGSAAPVPGSNGDGTRADNLRRLIDGSGVIRVPGNILTPLVPPTSISHDVSGRGTYAWGVHSVTSAAVATVTGASGDQDNLMVDRLGAVDQAITLKPLNGSARNVQLAMRSRLPQTPDSNVFVVENVSVANGASFTANVLADGKTLQLQNQGADATIQLTLQTGSGAKTGTKTLPIAAGKTATISAADWNSLGSSPVQINILGAPGGPVESTLTM